MPMALRNDATKPGRTSPVESTLRKPALVAARPTPKAQTIVYWMVTARFCLQMSFPAHAPLPLSQVAAGRAGG